jgi:hypothetical protein
LKRFVLPLSIFICLAIAPAFPKTGYIPQKGFVPDAQTAIVIARAVLVPIYGEAQIKREEPLTAIRRGDDWLVSGTLQCVPHCVGGVATVSISARSGQIKYVIHTK